MIQPSILFEGEGYCAVSKPPGALVIPGRGEEDAPSLKEELEASRKQKLWVVHRLDRDTSGVLLFALNAQVHRTLSMAFEAGQMEKRYWALVEGRMEAALDIDVPLMSARRGRMRTARPSEPGKPARTLVKPLELFASSTWVEATPLTGRTHQIRVHLHWAHHRLLFDQQYGPREPIQDDQGRELLSRTPLHAARLSIPKLEGVTPREIAAPLPSDMEKTIAHLRDRAQWLRG